MTTAFSSRAEEVFEPLDPLEPASSVAALVSPPLPRRRCCGAADAGAALLPAVSLSSSEEGAWLLRPLAYPEPLPNTHGFGHNNSTKVEDGFHDYSVVDTVAVPAGLAPGDYLLSWRWDCEQTTQVWQNCADIRITS
jgi:hypothetical protein